MPVLLILIGAVVGAGASENAFFGLLLGCLAGWLWSRWQVAQRELQALSSRLQRLERGTRPAVVRPPAEPPQPSAMPEPPTATPARPIAEPAVAASAAIASAEVERNEVAVEPIDSPPRPEPTARPAPAAPAWPPPGEPAGPDWAGQIEGFVKRWFTEGNVPVKIGMLLLFVGVAALLKYAVEQGMVSLPIELRLGAIGLAGAAALGFGWRQREQRRVFALSLQGGAIGVLLLNVFAAFAYWDLLPAGLAFGLVLVLIAGSAALALLQNAMALAVLGCVGGFLAPVLISTGSGNHVALFSYYALLNLAIFAIAWVRPWRLLNLIGFAFTFAIGSLWGYQYYRPDHFATTEPFLILFFLFYVAIAVLYALRQPQDRRGLVDGSLVFGTPLLAFPLQAALLKGDDMALAYSALAMAALYGLLAAMLFRRGGLRTLALSFSALAIGFATLAVPLALAAHWTACTWALEGAALIWLGLRQHQRLPVWSGIALQVLASAAWMAALDRHGVASYQLDPLMFLNGMFLGGTLLALAALFSALLLERDGGRPIAAWLGFGVGLAWWTWTGLLELQRFDDCRGAVLGWLAASMLLLAVLRPRLPWPRLGWPILLALASGALIALLSSDGRQPPLHAIAAWTWPLWLIAGLVALHALRRPQARAISIGHVLWLGTLALVAGLELHAHLRHGMAGETAWSAVALVLPLAGLLWASVRHPQRAAFPLADLFEQYRLRWWVPASAALGLWWFMSLFNPGDPAPLPFIPLLNPLELTQFGFVLMLFGVWRGALHGSPRPELPLIVVGMAFATISAATLRAVHHLAGLAWNERLWSSMLAQTSLTVVWSVLGVSAWVWGSRRGSRSIWLGGALLMGVVLAKLILIDRSHTGNIPGIVSFIAVGLLLTVVGYYAPSPPAPSKTVEDAQ